MRGSNEKQTEKAGWKEFLTAISIATSIIFAAVGLILNAMISFESRLKDDVKTELSQQSDLADQRSKLAAQELAQLYDSKTRNLQAEIDNLSRETKTDSAALDRIAKLPQAGMAFRFIEVSGSAKNCQSVTVKDVFGKTHTSGFTSICTIPKKAMQEIPENAEIVAAIIANSHYNLRLTTNRVVGSLDISDIANSQSASDRGSEGHAETIITLNDLTPKGGTFFVSRPSQNGWTPQSDAHWLWIGRILVFYQTQ